MTTYENRYHQGAVEEKWRNAWKKVELDTTDILQAKRPFYNLMMFPYPSAEGLHVGNMYAFTGSDIYGRFKRMQGYDVFEPIGLDGFGIHSENFALKIGRHPMDHAKITQTNYYNQLHTIGAMYDWNRTVETYDPDYYRWTQWLFVQMFKHGLAYRGKAEVNWCPSCKTVLADEQVTKKRVDSSVISAQAGIQPKERLDPRVKPEDDNSVEVCERCGNTVKKKQLEQWFFKITAYAEKLLQNSYGLDWSAKVKLAQQQWIGRKEGRKIHFGPIEVFTTRPDTILGATFVVLSPAHPLAGNIQEVVNPATKKRIPVFVDEYVLGTVGTGAIMGVPAYDERDKVFAKRMKLPIARAKLTKALFGEPMVTYHLRDWLISRQRYWGPPIPMVYCSSCAQRGQSWFSTKEAQSALRNPKSQIPNPKQIQNPKSKSSLEIGHWKLEIPAQSAGWYPAPEKDLPVILPRIEDYKPGDDGVAPLAKHKEFYETTCPKCHGKAVRETDVSDTFLDSSWYFLRYPSVSLDSSVPWDPSVTKKWLPVHMYTGGAEHSVLHLMYSRFIAMALHDWGYIDFAEPFTTFYAHGLVIKDGAKMSKSKGNVVNPDEYIARYGADALRLYLMFTGPFDQGGDFRDSAMEGMSRWVQKVWRMAQKSIDQHSHESSATVKKALHRAIKKVGEDIERRRYNTAIAAMMELVNIVGDERPPAGETMGVMGIEDLGKFLQILAPFAPYMTEELWQRMHDFNNPSSPPLILRGGRVGLRSGKVEIPEEFKSISQYTFTKSNSIHFQPWPTYDEKLLVEDTVEIAIQVNGKLRDTIVVSRQSSVVREDAEIAARKSEKVAKHLEGKTIKKVIFVPGKLINFVV